MLCSPKSCSGVAGMVVIVKQGQGLVLTLYEIETVSKANLENGVERQGLKW